MDKVFVVSMVSYDRRHQVMLGAYDTMLSAKKAAYEKYADVMRTVFNASAPEYNDSKQYVFGRPGNMYIIEVHGLEYTRTSEFPVSFVMRDDLKEKGFDVSNIDNETMESIASRMNEYSCNGIGYWDSLIEAAWECEVPRKEYEDDEK